VLGPPPDHRHPISVEQLRALAVTRADVEVRVSETGTRASRDMIVVDPTGNAPGTLILIDGRLQISNPDNGTVEWMLVLAKALNGRVVDDTLRTYRSPRETYVHPDDVAARKSLARKIRIARNKLIPFTHTVAKFVIWAIFAALGVTAYAIFK
jgi:hypothetical protein